MSVNQCPNCGRPFEWGLWRHDDGGMFTAPDAASDDVIAAVLVSSGGKVGPHGIGWDAICDADGGVWQNGIGGLTKASADRCVANGLDGDADGVNQDNPCQCEAPKR